MNRGLVFREFIFRQIHAQFPCRWVGRWEMQGQASCLWAKGEIEAREGRTSERLRLCRVTTFKSNVGPPWGPGSHYLTSCLGQDNRAIVQEKIRRWMKISKQHGCQLWLNTIAAWRVSNTFHVDDCFKSAINHYMFSCKSLPWRIGSQDPNTQTIHRV